MGSGSFSQLDRLSGLVILHQLQAGDVFFDGGNSGAAEDEFFESYVEKAEQGNHHREAKDHPDSAAHDLVIGQRKTDLSTHCGLEGGVGFVEESLCDGWVE